MSIRILLADDHAIVRDGLKALLELQPDLQVVCAVGDGREAVRAADFSEPDVAVLDISMPEMTGIEAARLIRAARPETRVVMLSMHCNAEHVYRSLHAGASGYVLKDAAGVELVTAVRSVHAGRRYLSERIDQMVIAGFLGEHSAQSPIDSLSRRERDILQMLADGHNNPDTARLLALSVKTVETYRSRLMQKLALGNFADLVKFAVAHGLTQVK